MPQIKKQKRTIKKGEIKKTLRKKNKRSIAKSSSVRRPVQKKRAKRPAVRPLPPHPVARLAYEQPKQPPLGFRLLSLVLLLLASLTNTGVVLAANRDMRQLDLRTTENLRVMMQPKEYLYTQAVEKGLDFALLERIAFCESNWRMARSNQSSAYGFFQIIDATEASTPQFKAGERKFDPFTNIDMAVYLFERYGSTPWTESKPCWWWYE